MTRTALLAIAAAAALLTACERAADPPSTENLTRHIKTLSSDEFEGRGPATPGEEKTLEYLEGGSPSL